jgi:imipenem/basic amino acid-specific outer membrane pore
MKLGKLSLVAVMALGTSAFAIENVKVSGDVKIIYQTSDVDLTAGEKTAGAQTGLFEQGTGAVVVVSPYNAASAGGITGRIGVTADLLKSVSAGAEVQVYSTLGLDNNVFGDNMINAAYGQTGFTNGNGNTLGLVTSSTFADRTKDASNISQLWLATTMGKTTVKAGRMELDTPLIFTEKWNLAYNTFESIVAVNTDLPDTSIVGAWIGKHNGHGAVDNRPNTIGVTPGDLRVEGGIRLAGSPGRTVNMDSFRTFGIGTQADGAYVLGAVNKSIANTTLQAWYYNVVSAADAVWLQADTKVAGMVTLGAQYATMNPSGDLSKVATSFSSAAGEESGKDSQIWAVKAAVDVAGVNLYAAYSKADDDGYLGFSNMSTADKTNIYTGLGSIYFDGVLTAPGVETVKIGVKGSVAGVTLEAAYVDASSALWSENYVRKSSNGGINGYDFSASTKVGNLGLTAIYTIVNNEATDGQFPPNGNPYYFGRDIDTLRLIAQLKF